LGETRNDGGPKGKSPLGRHRRKWEENIKMDFEIVQESVEDSSGRGRRCWEGMRFIGREGKADGMGSVLPSIATSALKMETVCFSETLASTDESTQCQNPEEHHAITNSKPLEEKVYSLNESKQHGVLLLMLYEYKLFRLLIYVTITLDISASGYSDVHHNCRMYVLCSALAGEDPHSCLCLQNHNWPLNILFQLPEHKLNSRVYIYLWVWLLVSCLVGV
jgi:hypothetical protein